MAAPTIQTLRSTWFAIQKPISKPEKWTPKVIEYTYTRKSLYFKV